MAKLTDVAALAGVSPTTVSRVINNYGSLSEKTKQKVFAAMHELNYQPNSLARSLQGKQTKLIGLIFPGVSNPFFGEMVEILENHLFTLGYRVILCNAGDDKAKERDYLRMLIANQVDGIIAGAHNLDIQEYQQVGLPIVSFDRYLSDQIPIVSSDNAAGGQQAAKLLTQAGGTKLQVITGKHSPKSPTNARQLGFQNELQRHPEAHLQVDQLNFSSAPTIKALRIRDILTKNQPDAVFCTDDLTALLVKQQASQLGLAVPDQLKIMGYDGSQFIQDYHPELATIVQPIEDMVTLMIDLLTQRINDPQVKLQQHYTLPVKTLSGKTVF